jgi:hypothetical protein
MFDTERKRVESLYKMLVRYLRGAEMTRSRRVGGSKIWSFVRKRGIVVDEERLKINVSYSCCLNENLDHPLLRITKCPGEEYN